MTISLRAVPLLATLLISAVVGAQAQDQAAATGGSSASSIPIRVQLVISRYQGDKRVSSVPFTVVVNATDLSNRIEEPSRLRMGVELPMPANPSTPGSKPAVATGPAPAVDYRAFGTNLDLFAKVLDRGRFKLNITVEESAPYSDQDSSKITASGKPILRSFRASSVLLLKDGQSEQFSTATDKFSGEVVKMDVTLSVIK